jgi:hypothetical protein
MGTHLPAFESTGIIFYILGVQWQQREIFSSPMLACHGIFASMGSAPKMHLLDDETMKAPRGFACRHASIFRAEKPRRAAVASASRSGWQVAQSGFST